MNKIIGSFVCLATLATLTVATASVSAQQVPPRAKAQETRAQPTVDRVRGVLKREVPRAKAGEQKRPRVDAGQTVANGHLLIDQFGGEFPTFTSELRAEALPRFVTILWTSIARASSSSSWELFTRDYDGKLVRLGSGPVRQGQVSAGSDIDFELDLHRYIERPNEVFYDKTYYLRVLSDSGSNSGRFEESVSLPILHLGIRNRTRSAPYSCPADTIRPRSYLVFAHHMLAQKTSDRSGVDKVYFQTYRDGPVPTRALAARVPKYGGEISAVEGEQYGSGGSWQYADKESPIPSWRRRMASGQLKHGQSAEIDIWIRAKTSSSVSDLANSTIRTLRSLSEAAMATPGWGRVAETAARGPVSPHFTEVSDSSGDDVLGFARLVFTNDCGALKVVALTPASLSFGGGTVRSNITGGKAITYNRRTLGTAWLKVFPKIPKKVGYVDSDTLLEHAILTSDFSPFSATANRFATFELVGSGSNGSEYEWGFHIAAPEPQ